MATIPKEPQRVLTVYLLKTGTGPTSALLPDKVKTLTKHSITLTGSAQADLYSVKSKTREPSWAAFFAGTGIDLRKLGLLSASASAVLFVAASKRHFAVCFGYGKYFLDPTKLQSHFGLKTTLNAVPPDKIRSIDRTTFEAVSTQTKEQASKESGLESFGLNIEKDILRAVVGTPKDSQFAKRLTGMDALTITTRVTPKSIEGRLGEALKLYESQEYKKHYAWIDHVAEVRDEGTRDLLDQDLLALIKARSSPNVWMAVPEVIEWSDLEGFRYSTASKAPPEDDIFLEAYLKTVDVSTLSIEKLRRDRVVAIRATSGLPTAKWSIYRCLYVEMDRKGSTYLINGGTWYEVEKNFVKLVHDAISRIPETRVALLDFASGEREAAYNRRLGASLPKSCVLDANNLIHGGGSSSIEACDVLTDAGAFIHVKRYGGSSVLSHLFSQGLVAGTAFASDPEFREKLNQKLPTNLQLADPKARPDCTKYEVAYVVASVSGKSLGLPFFSRVNLKHASDILRGFGYSVTLSKVKQPK